MLFQKITLYLETEGSDRYSWEEQSFLGNSGGHGGIPWMKLNWKISMAITKKQRGKSSTSQQVSWRVAVLKANGSRELIPSSPEGRGLLSHEVGS